MACARPTLPSPVPFSLPPRAVPAPFAAGLAALRRGGVPVLASKAACSHLVVPPHAPPVREFESGLTGTGCCAEPIPRCRSEVAAEDLGGIARRSRPRPLSWRRNRQAVSLEQLRAISRDSLGAERARFSAGIASEVMSPARWLVFIREAYEGHEGERGVFRNRGCQTGGSKDDRVEPIPM